MKVLLEVKTLPYVAHAAIALSYDATSYEKDKWYRIKEADHIEFRWRLSSSLLYEVIAGTFEEKISALQCAKQMYVTLLYSALSKQLPIQNAGCDIYESRFFDPSYDIDYCSYIDNESFFFWNQHYKGGLLGPGVYEVENSIDDFDKCSFISMTVSASSPDIKLDLNNIDDYIFTYNRETQQLLSTVVMADNVCDYGMQMTMYCGLLEHLSENGYKDAQVISEIERLVDYVKCSELSDAQKSQIINPLTTLSAFLHVKNAEFCLVNMLGKITSNSLLKKCLMKPTVSEALFPTEVK